MCCCAGLARARVESSRKALLGQFPAFLRCFTFLGLLGGCLRLLEDRDEVVNLVNVDLALVLLVEDFEHGLILHLVYREVIGCHYY